MTLIVGDWRLAVKEREDSGRRGEGEGVPSGRGRQGEGEESVSYGGKRDGRGG